MVKKWLKLKQSKRTPIGVVRRLRAKRQVKTLRGAPKEGLFVLFLFFSTFSSKTLKMKAFLEVSLISLNLTARTFLKFFEKMQAILLYWFATRQSSTLTRQKFGFLYAKFSAEFNEVSFFF